MYTINFYEHSFQSKENIQYLLDQLITQIRLLNYQFNYTELYNPDDYNETILYIFTMNSSAYFHIKLHINVHSNILNSIKFEKINFPKEKNKDFQTDHYSATDNFTQILETIINLL